MTTIAVTRDQIAADSRCVWDGVGTDAYLSVKIYRGRQSLFAITGEDCDGSLLALEWLQDGARHSGRLRPVKPDGAKWDWKIVELSSSGIAVHNTLCEREETLEPYLAFGSGRKVAYYCMKYLGMSPAHAVAEACKVDDYSDHPIYIADLSDLAIRKWTAA